MTMWRQNRWWVIGALGALLLGAVLLGLSVGSTDISWTELWSALLGGEAGPAHPIVRYVRLPRVMGAVVCGGALAVGGVLIQGVLGNPLAGPNLIGINSGAGLGAILCAAWFPASLTMVPLAAFAGALLACFFVDALARSTGAGPITLVLAGVAISSMLSAAIDSVGILVPDAALGANAFLVGRLAGVTMKSLVLPALLTGGAIFAAWALSHELDLLTLGEEVAQSIGLSTRRMRSVLLILAAILCGSAVSFAGLVGFVGLLVPHACRLLVGGEHRILIPASMLMGGSLVTLCDLTGRVAFAPFELPVGILLSLLGGPFFLWLLFHPRGGIRR